MASKEWERHFSCVEEQRDGEDKRYQLYIVGFTSTQSTGSGTLIQERGWTLLQSRPGRELRVEVFDSKLTSPAECSPKKQRVASMLGYWEEVFVCANALR